MTHPAATAGTAADADLGRRIATMMRVGNAAVAVLLGLGAACGYLHAGLVTTLLLTAGCGLMILLPVIRLAMMAGHFTRLVDHRFLAVTLTVLALVVAGGMSGLVL